MKKKIISLLALIAIMFLPIGFVNAEEYFVADENVTDEAVYEHSHFEAGNIVNSKSDVNGLSFVAGSNVDISGKKEYGFFAGETVKINGDIEKDLFAAGNNVVISKDTNIGRDVYLAGNSITINSDINGAVFIAGSLVTLDNITIVGDVTIAANTVQIQNNVDIIGKLKINENAIINNEKDLKANVKEVYKDSTITIDFKTKASEVVLSILSTLFTALIIVVAFPKLFKKINYDLDAKDIGKKLLYGLLTLLIVPMISIIAMTIIVGFSVSVMIIMLYVIAIMISTIFASVVIGQNIYTKLFKQKDNLYIDTIIGILLVKLVSFIPILGGLISLLVFLYGLGIVCKLFLERNK